MAAASHTCFSSLEGRHAALSNGRKLQHALAPPASFKSPFPLVKELPSSVPSGLSNQAALDSR